MAQELAFAAPRAEEMTRTGVAVGVGVATGMAQGVVTKFAPQFGAIAPVITWASLLITPLVGVAGALFTRGMISDAFLGVAAGSGGVFGHSLPGLLPEFGLARRPQGQGQLPPGAGVKQLPPGARFAPQRQQAAVAAGITAEI